MKISNINKSYKVLGLVVGLAVLAFTFHSCNPFDLDEDPSNSRLAILPYTNQAELNLAVNGAYDRLHRALWMTTAWVSAWGGDDLTTHRASNKADFREYDQRAVSNGNSRTRNTWNVLFQAIRATNVVLANAAETNLPDRVEQDRLIGEAHFIRGYCYHHLIRVFERLPLVTSSVPDFEIGLSSREDVFKFIESDYRAAEAMLPMSSTPGTTKPSVGTARGFLARLYMDWAGYPTSDESKYAQAASTAQQVISNAGEHGFALVPDMATLYTLEGAANSEGVFTMSYCQSCNNRSNRKMGKLGLPGDLGGWQESFAEIRFFEDMPENYRKDVTYHTEVPINAAGNRPVNDPSTASGILKWTEFKDQQNPVFAKIVGPWEDGTWNGFQSSRADYLMRYAEVLLIHAEASGRSGAENAAAWESLNQVRRRSEGLPVDQASDVDLTSGDLAELAYTEKKWELAGEYQRWYDLVRMQRVDQALSNRNPQVSIGTDENGGPKPLTEASNPILGSLGTDNYFAPIPPDEVAQLPGLGGG